MADSSVSIRAELKRILFIVVVVVFPIIAGVLWWKRHDKALSDAPPIEIAVAVHLAEASGQSIRDATQMRVDELNAAGGVAGRRVQVVVHDDQGKVDQAGDVAKKVAASGAVAVIGHQYSDMAIGAAEVYAANKIPLISPAATNDAVTKGNPWAFRTIFNDTQQGRFLAAYMKHGLGVSRIGFVATEGVYSEHLKRVFLDEAENHELDSRGGVVLPRDADVSAIKQTLEGLLNQESPPEALFLPLTFTDLGARVLRALYEIGFEGPLVATDSLAGEFLFEEIDKVRDPKVEKSDYTRNLMAAMPLIFDTANASAQRFRQNYRDRVGAEPRWEAAFAYDAMDLALAALDSKRDVAATTASVPELRESIRSFLSDLNRPELGRPGVTGLNFFSPDGDALKPLSVAVFQGDFVSALVQMRTALPPSKDSIPSPDSRDLIKVGDGFITRAQVVYTGIRWNRIENLNVDKGTVDLDLDIWFRYQRPLDISKFEVMNAVEPVVFDNPKKSLDHEKMGYRFYRLKGTFRTNFIETLRPGVGEHIVGIGLRHRQASANKLLFVVDVTGMPQLGGSSPVAELMSRKVLEPELELTPRKVWVAQEVTKRDVLGDPQFVFGSGHQVDQSTFLAAARLGPTAFTARRRLEFGSNDRVLLIGVLVLFALYVLNRLIGRGRLRRSIFFLEIVAWGLVLLIAEVFTLEVIGEKRDVTFLANVIRGFDVMWWVAGAGLASSGFERLVWTPVEARTQRPIPRVAKQFTSALIYALATFGVLAFVFDMKLTGVLATSGLFAMIIGLAVQMNISNIFSGVILNIERPFRIGDIVTVGSTHGTVKDVSWRATKLQTNDGEIISIPNAVAAESVIHNYTFPNPKIRLRVTVRVDQKHAPDLVRTVLEGAVEDAKPAIRAIEPSNPVEPQVRFQGVTERCSEFLVGTKVLDYGHRSAIAEALQLASWRALDAVGIEMISQRTGVELIDRKTMKFATAEAVDTESVELGSSTSNGADPSS